MARGWEAHRTNRNTGSSGRRGARNLDNMAGHAARQHHQQASQKSLIVRFKLPVASLKQLQSGEKSLFIAESIKAAHGLVKLGKEGIAADGLVKTSEKWVEFATAETSGKSKDIEGEEMAKSPDHTERSEEATESESPTGSEQSKKWKLTVFLRGEKVASRDFSSVC